MVCIYCGHDTEVYNSRAKARTPSIWRRRRCLSCVAQFTTLELPDYASALVVSSPSGLTPFDRDKLFLSIFKSLGHRPDALRSSSELTTTIIGKLLKTQSAPEGVLELNTIAMFAHHALKRYDLVAATTYRAYHPAALKLN